MVLMCVRQFDEDIFESLTFEYWYEEYEEIGYVYI